MTRRLGLSTLTGPLRRTIRNHLRHARSCKILNVFDSSEYASGSGPAASHLAASPLPRYEGNVGQDPRIREIDRPLRLC